MEVLGKLLNFYKKKYGDGFTEKFISSVTDLLVSGDIKKNVAHKFFQDNGIDFKLVEDNLKKSIVKKSTPTSRTGGSGYYRSSC